MGSFDETCALSNLKIGYECPIRMVFLTKNPYECKRGNYISDQWFVRTPPIKGVYSDYAKATYDDNNKIIKIIEKCFDKDAVERPFGFNQYHDPPVCKGMNIHQYLNAAWEGRLFVKDDYYKELKENDNFPNWKIIKNLLLEAGLEIQKDENHEAYNAQPVIPGVVCVRYNSYKDNSKELNIAKDIISQHFDCEIIKTTNKLLLLIVTVKGGFENHALLLQDDYVEYALKSGKSYQYRQLPVLSVMIREDVWQEYCKINLSKKWNKITIKDIADKIKEILSGDFYIELKARDVRDYIPFQSGPIAHIKLSKELDLNDNEREELIQNCAELLYIENIMDRLHQSWYIPQTSGQGTDWETRIKLLSGLLKISKNELKKEKEE